MRERGASAVPYMQEAQAARMVSESRLSSNPAPDVREPGGRNSGGAEREDNPALALRFSALMFDELDDDGSVVWQQVSLGQGDRTEARRNAVAARLLRNPPERQVVVLLDCYAFPQHLYLVIGTVEDGRISYTEGAEHCDSAYGRSIWRALQACRRPRENALSRCAAIT